MTIYLSGPITGKAAAAADFKKLAQSARRRYGADAVILSPMRHPAGLTPAAYMRLAFADIDAADVVLQGQDWYRSPGARLERDYACYTKTRVETEVGRQEENECHRGEIAPRSADEDNFQARPEGRQWNTQDGG